MDFLDSQELGQSLIIVDNVSKLMDKNIDKVITTRGLLLHFTASARSTTLLLLLQVHAAVCELTQALQDQPSETATLLRQSQHVLQKAIDKYSKPADIHRQLTAINQAIAETRPAKRQRSESDDPIENDHTPEPVSAAQREFGILQSQLRAEYKRLLTQLREEGEKYLRQSYTRLAQHKTAGQTYVDSAVKAVQQAGDEQIKRLRETTQQEQLA